MYFEIFEVVYTCTCLQNSEHVWWNSITHFSITKIQQEILPTFDLKNYV